MKSPRVLTYVFVCGSLACVSANAQKIGTQSEADFQELMPVSGEVDTYFGKFELDHSFSAPGEADKIYELMDHQRASQLYLWGLPIVGMNRFYQG